ncbi:Mutanase [Penicillium atrosanguineum]|uniref:Mutanase n=1 Tax=Penicillium atrosanguineum TaxID=1132637 RepID=A0A9W9U1X4_9EURO|nr:Mutanase [Penicillium atrosanguineum]
MLYPLLLSALIGLLSVTALACPLPSETTVYITTTITAPAGTVPTTDPPTTTTTTPTMTAISSTVPSSTPTGSTDRLVFCHFMIGITSNRQSSAEYDGDMKHAKALGIDAFALNIGTDSYTDTQLGYAYDSAARNGMNVFLSFDFNWWHIDQGSAVGAKIREYADHSAQLKVDGKIFVSSFSGDGVDVSAMTSAAGQDLFFAPNFHPGQGDFSAIQGALNWMAWPNNGDNKAPSDGKNIDVADGDQAYMNALKGKPYVAPVSAWFSTHFGDEVSYSKNWVFPSDLLWYNRWRDILQLGPRFVEIITWNDYGESHYIGPLSSPHTDDGSSKWAMDMPHTGWLEMSKPFIAAYKAGVTDPMDYITEEKLVYWYRPTKKDVDCDATDTTMQGNPNNSSGNFFRGRPNGWEAMTDEVFVVALLKSPARVLVQSGDQSQAIQAPAGISAHSVPMGVGQQKFAVTRDGQTILSGTSLKDIVDTCVCGIYNFNAQGVFSWEDVLVQRYQSNKPPVLPRRRHTLSVWQPQPQCYLLSRLSPELRLMIWEYVLGSQRLHIIQRSGQKLGHMVCPLSENRTPDKTRRRVHGNFCEICTGAGIAQPVKEGDLRRTDILLGLALTSRQIYDESIHLLYTLNTFEFSNPWTLPYLRPTLPPDTWECIRNVELRWSFPGHWLPSKDPVRAVYVSAGRVQWLETCRMLNNLPALQSFVLVLGSSWFCEPVEKLPLFLEPLRGLRVNCPRGLVRRTVGLDPELWEFKFFQLRLDVKCRRESIFESEAGLFFSNKLLSSVYDGEAS